MIRFRSVTSSAAAALLLIHVPASGEVQMSPLTTFAGDGWLAPLEVSWLSDTGATERSIAYSASNDTLYVASRNGGPHIRMLDGTAGTELNAASEGVAMTGVSGGTFSINCVAATPDGVLYASNLVSPVTAASGFKIYRWDDVGSGPVTVFNSNTITAGRMGDTLDAFGSGASTQLVAGESNSTGSGTRNGYAIFAPPAAGTDFTGTLVTFSGANPAAGDFRTGITFLDADSVVGSQGAGGFKFTSFAGATGTFDQAKLLTNTSERPMDYIVLGGVPLLATIECNGNTTAPPVTFSTVRLYDLTVFNAPVLAASGRTATTYNTQGTSGPGTGSVQWGKVTGNSATLYALSTNNGIQAFTVTVTAAAVPPSVTGQPASRTVFERGVATFSVTAGGTPPFSYQWFRDTQPVPDATSASLTIRPVTAASAGSYTCRVTGAANPPANSDPAVLTVAPSVNTGALTETWLLEPGSRPYLSSDDTQRGLAYNSAKNRLYLPLRAPAAAVQILNAADGSDAGTLNVTGVSGGTFVLNCAAVADDGVLYAANMSAAGDGYRIYQWPDDQADVTPAVVFNGGDYPSFATRIGDSLAVRGSGATTEIAAGMNSTNQLVIFRQNESGFFIPYTVTVAGAPNGAFGLTIAFGAGNTVWGKANGGAVVLASYDVDQATGNPTGTGTLLASIPTASVPGSGGAIALDPANGFLAHIHPGDSDNVRLYDLPVPLPQPAPALTLLDQEFYRTDNPNPFNTGTAILRAGKLFALDTANGLAAYTVTRPEVPPVITDVALAGNAVSFKLRGTAGKTYLIEKSPQLAPLASWTGDGSVTLTAAEETVSRVIPAGTVRMYYRAREIAAP